MSPHLRRRKTHCVGWEQLLSSVLACWWSQRCWVRASLLPGLGASPPFPPSIPPWIVYVCHWVFVSLFVLCACDFECVGCWGRVGVSVPVCVCVPVWVGSRSHRILPTSSLFASAQHNYLNKNTKIQKEIRKPPLSLPLYNSVILNTKTPWPSTNQRTSSHFTIIQSEQNPSQWHLCSSYEVTAVKMGATHTIISILLHLCCAHLSPLFDQRRKYCRVSPGST